MKNAELVYKGGSASGDYHGQMNQVNFEKWVDEKLIPYLPPKSVVVMDNAPYHSVQVDKPPNKYAPKRNMIGWLRRKGVEVNERLHKVDLFSLIEKHRPQENTFRVDQRRVEFEHTVLRLPPYMCDLFPIELAWKKMKHKVRGNNVTGDLSFQRLKELTEMALSSIAKEEWEGYCQHTLKVEIQYRVRHNTVLEVVDNLIISLGDEDDSDSDDSSNSNDDDDDDDDAGNDSELATPL